ncbi:MAG: hypothetical protein ACRDQ5_27355 [Sciscionella sp.]
MSGNARAAGVAVTDPQLLGVAPAEPPEQPSAPPHLGVVLTAPKPAPKGWPAGQVEPVWRWLSTRRAPIAVLVAGVEGGVGTSTTAALVAETIAAGSCGPTVLLDQCGSPWASVSRRVFGERAGLDGAQVAQAMRSGITPLRLLATAPTSSAGAAVVADPAVRTPLRELGRLVAVSNGSLVVDAGRVDLLLTARLELHPVVVAVGRTDVAGAEALCAALAWLRGRGVTPVVVLDTTMPGEQRRRTAARTLLSTAGADAVAIPHDPRLAHGGELRLDRLATATASALLQLLGRLSSACPGGRHDR